MVSLSILKIHLVLTLFQGVPVFSQRCCKDVVKEMCLHCANSLHAVTLHLDLWPWFPREKCWTTVRFQLHLQVPPAILLQSILHPNEYTVIVLYCRTAYCKDMNTNHCMLFIIQVFMLFFYLMRMIYALWMCMSVLQPLMNKLTK